MSEEFLIPKTNIYTLRFEGLQQELVSHSHPKFRAKQIWDWLYNKGVQDFSLMKNISKKIQVFLDEKYVIGKMHIDTEQNSADGTIKRLYKLEDSQLIETVLMPYADGRQTACISSQVISREVFLS